ncbi:MAG: endonuclease/exonuclease/phosphatase family protein [Puniceicoccales bacterium]|jgi:endonuclease/exonuclease/phosphatase family metal-dependent hydrolase|nr:endonuclease/exonuclease/phosphatase family protein [Puniceicoccales bacterium]
MARRARHIICSILGLFCFAATLSGERLRVATFNTQNYTLEYRPGGGNGPVPKPESEKAAMRFLICATAPDVLALQEIGGTAFVEELRRDLTREGASYAHVAVLNSPDKKRQLAILSKKPFKKVLRHDNIRTHYMGKDDVVLRGLLGVVLSTTEGDFTFYTVHLKSRLSKAKSGDQQSAAQRLAEAVAICSILNKAHASNPSKTLALIGGDFNDSSRSKTVLRFSDEHQLPPFSPLYAGDSRNETWTYRNLRDDFYDRSDYFLATPSLAQRARERARIVDLPASVNASDHRMVYVDLEFRKNTK